jgi:hydrogenase maturation protease
LVVVFGVGNRLRGDDAVGCIVCDEMRNSPPRHKDTEGSSAGSSIVHRPSSVPEETGTVPASPALDDLGALGGSSFGDSVFVLDCGSTPENYIQPVADRNPTRILVVDCCDYGAKPGEFRLFSRPEIEQLSYGLLSTHTLPLTLTIEMLSLQTHATIELLGIQPERIGFGESLSEPVQRALPAVVEFVCNWAKAGTTAS